MQLRHFLSIATSLVACAALALVTSQSGPPAADRAQDEAAIRALLDQMVSGWAEGSGEKFAAPFAENADYVVVNGMHLKGRQQIDEGHQQIFDTFYKGTQVAGRVESIRFLRPDVAVMHVGALVPAPGKRQDPSSPDFKPEARITIVALKGDDGRWQIEAFQNTPIQPPGPPQGAQGGQRPQGSR